jgi:hypothetical protein
MTDRRLHVALAVRDLAESIRDYSARLGVAPCCIVDGQYALWRTNQVNLSISVKADAPGTLRHLGFEDPRATEMSVERDANGVDWERFTEAQQRDEIVRNWPHARFMPPDPGDGG